MPNRMYLFVFLFPDLINQSSIFMHSTHDDCRMNRYLDGTENGKTIAKPIEVTPSLLREWIRRYES